MEGLKYLRPAAKQAPEEDAKANGKHAVAARPDASTHPGLQYLPAKQVPPGPTSGLGVEQGGQPQGQNQEQGNNPKDGAANTQDSQSSSLWEDVKGGVSAVARSTDNMVRNTVQALPLGVFVDEATAAVSAGAQKLGGLIGLSNDKRSFGEIYRADRDQERAANDRAAQDKVANAFGQSVGLVTGGKILNTTASGGAKAVGLGATEILATGAGASKAELTGENKDIIGFAGDVVDAAKLTPLALASAPKTGRKAERAYTQQVTQDIGTGATQVQQRRMAPNAGAAETIVDLVEREPGLKKVITGDREELAAAAQKVLDDRSTKVAPVYAEFDAAGGKVPVGDLVQHIDGQIASLAQRNGTEAMRNALNDVKEDVLNVSKARAAAQGLPKGAKTHYSHQELRDWVTQLLLKQQKTMGSLAETERAQIVNDLHEMGDSFLNRRLDDVAAAKPELKKQLDGLRANNRDISAAVRIKDVAENADKAEFRKRSKLPERMSMMTAGTLGSTAAIVGGSAGGVLPAVIAGAGGLAAGALTKQGARLQTEMVGRLARAARQGSIPAKLVEEAIQAGVPQRTIRALQVNMSQDDNDNPVTR